MALYGIGDVHGCAQTLQALLDRLAEDAGGALGPADTLVFVGDYVDRGPDSPGVIDQLVELERQSDAGAGPRCVFLRGNHDQMMLDYVDGVGRPGAVVGQRRPDDAGLVRRPRRPPPAARPRRLSPPDAARRPEREGSRSSTPAWTRASRWRTT